VALGASALLAGCAHSGPAYAPPPKDVAAVVTATSTLAFEPATVTVHTGDTVEWRNTSLFTHTVTDEPAKARSGADATLPEGAMPFRAELPPGQIYRHSFNVAGTYHYFCEPHERFGMAGMVIVVPSVQP
jgi:plastocyanin